MNIIRVNVTKNSVCMCKQSSQIRYCENRKRGEKKNIFKLTRDIGNILQKSY